MSVIIGHASINEKGGTRGGAPGDQTGGEVCKRSWYDKNWDVLLRPKRYELAISTAKICADVISNNFVGYDQKNRNSLYFYMKENGFNLSKINKPLSVDCSSFMTFCAISAGVDKLNYKTNAPTTRNMTKMFVDTGEYEGFTDKKYLTLDKYLQIGDILVSVGHHTVMVLSNGEKVKLYPERMALYEGEVSARSLCVRKKPKTGETLYYLFSGDHVYIYEIDKNTNWYNISGKRDEWVSNNYIKLK